jgi:hypothetical protein
MNLTDARSCFRPAFFRPGPSDRLEQAAFREAASSRRQPFPRACRKGRLPFNLFQATSRKADFRLNQNRENFRPGIR